MKKLTLDADELAVETFEASERDESIGTVRGQEEMYASSLLTCEDTNCGKTYCTTRSPCAC